ncbi:DUF3786 domain-containing protein [Candidatus Hydrogenedentota bacterium]
MTEKTDQRYWMPAQMERQTNYETAFCHGIDQVKKRPPDSLEELGARAVGEGLYELRVLDGLVAVDLENREVSLASCVPGEKLSLEWQILVLHYLASASPWPDINKWVGYSDFAEARGYEQVYRGRVLGRLCGTAGRTRDAFVDACTRIGGEVIDWGDEGFVFNVFPRISIKVAWHDGDEDLPPSVSMLYPDNIVFFMCVEDLVVLSESLVSRLQKVGWH